MKTHFVAKITYARELCETATARTILVNHELRLHHAARWICSEYVYQSKKSCSNSSNKSVRYSKWKYDKLSEVVNGHFTFLIRGGRPRNVPKFITHVHSTSSAQKTFGLVTGVKFTLQSWCTQSPLYIDLLQASLLVSGNVCYFFLICQFFSLLYMVGIS